MTRVWTRDDAARALRLPKDDDDKYSRGVLGMRIGSEPYPGAAVLGVEAAWRTGVGMVRYLGPARPTGLVLMRRPETVTVDGRVQAWVIGSGTDASARTVADTDALRAILADTDPVVADAGALDLAARGTAPRILTPHDREHARLDAALGLPPPRGDRASAAQATADATGAVVLLKGARTIVAAPGSAPITVASATPWLATAGTGDVLAGVLGALLAGHAAAGRATAPAALAAVAATGAWLHGRAGVRAVERAEGGPVTALDVAEALPAAVAEVLAA